MEVSLVVRPACRVTADPLIFDGNEGAAIDAQAKIAVTCNGDTSVSVALDSGTNELAGQRRLAGSAGHVTYAIFSDPARTIEWDAARPWTGEGGALVLTAYGRVDAAATLGASGSYSDVIAITVDF